MTSHDTPPAANEAPRLLNTLYLNDHRSRANLKRGSLLVSTAGNRKRVPLQAIDAVVIFAGHITTDAIAECVKRNVRVSVLTRGGKVRFTAGPPVCGNVHLRTAQHAAATDPIAATSVAKLIVAAKIRNSATVTRRWARDHTEPSIARDLNNRTDRLLERIEAVSAATDRDTLRGIEGDAARLYFKGVSAALAATDLTFTARARRPPRDPANAAMSFCYALITTETTGACDAIGLDPQIGFLHQSLRAGRPSLALDITEELRSLTDRFVVSAARRGQISTEDFTGRLGTSCYLTDDGRRKLLSLWEQHKNILVDHPVLQRAVPRWAVPTVQATLLARWLRGDLPGYPPLTLKD